MSGLPAGFDTLEPYVADWARPTTADRDAARTELGTEARQAFYEAAKDLLEPALSYLDATPLVDHSPAQTNLMNLMLSFAHVSLAIEVQGPDEAKHTVNRQQLIITKSPADR
jgi:hypothetical protein